MKVGKFVVIGIGSWSWCSWRRTYKVSKFILSYPNFSYKTKFCSHYLVSARTHSVSRSIYIQTFCIHKRNVLRFLRHGTYHEVVRRVALLSVMLTGGGGGFKSFKTQGRANTFFWKKKNRKFPSPPLQGKAYLPLCKVSVNDKAKISAK